MAVGFEPTVGLTPHNISSVAPSAARTRHRRRDYRTADAGLNRATSGEELVEQRGRLACQDTSNDLGAVVEPSVAHDVPQRAHRARLVVEGTEDDAFDPGDDDDLSPDEMLSEVARSLGFGELFDDAVGFTSA